MGEEVGGRTGPNGARGSRREADLRIRSANYRPLQRVLYSPEEGISGRPHAHDVGWTTYPTIRGPFPPAAQQYARDGIELQRLFLALRVTKRREMPGGDL